MPLTNITPGVWEAFSDVRFMGMPMNARTTIASLSDGLFVCSPGALNDDLRREIDALGEVRAIVAPNRFHHLFIQDWRTAYPDASVHVPESLKKKRPDLANVHSLGASEIASEIAQQHMAGFPAIDETWFFHRPSGTLIDTDLMHNTHEEPRWYPRMAWRALGSWKKFGPSALERMLIRDREGFAESLEKVLEWDIDRVVVAHGEVLEDSDPKARIRDSWRGVLG